MKRFEEAHIRFVHEGTNIGGYSLQYPAHFLAKEDLLTILPLYVEMSYLAAAPQNKCCESWRFARYIKPTQNSSIIEPICLSRRSLFLNRLCRFEQKLWLAERDEERDAKKRLRCYCVGVWARTSPRSDSTAASWLVNGQTTGIGRPGV